MKYYFGMLTTSQRIMMMAHLQSQLTIKEAALSGYYKGDVCLKSISESMKSEITELKDQIQILNQL